MCACVLRKTGLSGIKHKNADRIVTSIHNIHAALHCGRLRILFILYRHQDQSNNNRVDDQGIELYINIYSLSAKLMCHYDQRKTQILSIQALFFIK